MKFDTGLFSSKMFLAFILLIAFILRFYNIDFQSLWLDEIYTMNMSDPSNSLMEVYRLSPINDPLSVLYFTLLNVFFKIFTFSSFLARLFSLIFGVLGIWVVYLLGKELRNVSTGIIASVLLTFNYFHICYSQEARVYTMFMAFTCLSFLFLIRYLKKPGMRNAIYYGLSMLLMLHSHFYAWFTVFSHVIILLAVSFYMKKVTLKRFMALTLISVTVVIIGYIPIIPIFIKLAKNTSTWIPPIANSAFFDMFGGFFGSSYLVVSMAFLFIMYFFISVFSERSQPSESPAFESKGFVFSILGIWILCTFLLPYYNSFIKFPMLVDRYMIGMVPALILMMAVGLDLVVNQKLRYALVGLFVVISFLSMTVEKPYYNRPYKATFREATRFVIDNNASNSRISTSLPYHFGYYLRAYKNTAPVDGDPLDTFINRMRSGLIKPGPFWALDGHDRVFKISDTNQKYLAANFEEVMNFSGISTWAKFFVPASSRDSAGVLLKLNSTNFFEEAPYLYDNNIYIYNNGFIESKPFNLDSGNYRLVAKTRSTGSQAPGDTSAHVTYYIGNKKIGDYFIGVNSYLQGDTMEFNVPGKEPFSIKIGFDNDAIINGQDRNVVIREIRILNGGK